MLYMVELKYNREHRQQALNYFWEHGTTFYEGKVVLKGLWVATHDQIAYALVESDDEEEIKKASAPLAAFGTFAYRQVFSSEQI